MLRPISSLDEILFKRHRLWNCLAYIDRKYVGGFRHSVIVDRNCRLFPVRSSIRRLCHFLIDNRVAKWRMVHSKAIDIRVRSLTFSGLQPHMIGPLVLNLSTKESN